MTGCEENRVLNQELEAVQAWDPGRNQALACLLDHVAEELAHEYIRLMEAALESDAASVGDSRPDQE